MKTRDIHRAEPRHDMMKSHLIAEERHDTYKARKKPSEPSVCPKCMAVFIRGRWQWTDEHLEKAEWETCPACHRMADKYPAGELTVSGSFVKDHKDEFIRLARNTEALERSEHPLQRIMEINETPEGMVITTTDIHLPRRIAHAFIGAFKGDLETKYDEAGYFVRMHWKRDA